MRPRYRVWDKEEKKMIYDAEHTYDNYPVNISSFGAMLDLPDSFDVMQYIGINDVNGKRVYETDIVKIVTTQTEETRIGEVKYYDDNACFLVETTNEEYFTFMSSDISRVEVLGNIHKNKELLNTEEVKQPLMLEGLDDPMRITEIKLTTEQAEAMKDSDYDI